MEPGKTAAGDAAGPEQALIIQCGRGLAPSHTTESQYLGQDMMSQVILRYPQIAHLVPRDLLWFFGGDCLHFMPDEELDLYQALEER
uniref:PA2817 family protein n=1 Tax=Pseudomonas veronii TaxID=76761 RepID=UPI003C739539